METQQMTEFLLKIEADRKTDKDEMMAKLDANQEKMEADMKADQKEWRPIEGT
jgi:hypothetical protein